MMSERRRLALGLLAVCVVGIWFFGEQYRQRFSLDFAHAFAPIFSIPAVGRVTDLSMESARAMPNSDRAFFIAGPLSRLSRYSTAADKAPLFSFSGSDTVQLRASVGALEQALSDLRRLPEFRGRQDVLEALQVIHPISFLSSIPDLEEARRELVTHASFVGAWRYHMLLVKTIGAYRSDLEGLRTELKRSSGTGVDSTYYYPERAVTASSVDVFLSKLDAAAAHDLAKEEWRFACLEGSGSCSNEPTPAPSPAPEPLIPASIADSQSGDVSTSTSALLIQDLLNVQRIPENQRFHFIADTGCFNDSHPEPMHVVGWFSVSGPEHAPSMWLQPVETLFFNPISYGKTGTFASLVAAGYSEHMESAGNFYVCPDLSYYARLATVLSIRDYVRMSPILSAPNVSSEEAVIHAASLLEQRIVANEAMDERVFEAYETDLALLEGRYSDRQLSAMLGGDREVSRLHRVVSLWRDQSGHLESLIMHGAEQVRRFGQLAEDLGPVRNSTLSPLYLLSIRSYFSLYFFPFNRSIADPPPSLGASDASLSKAAISLADMEEKYTTAQLQKLIRLQYQDRSR